MSKNTKPIKANRIKSVMDEKKLKRPQVIDKIKELYPKNPMSYDRFRDIEIMEVDPKAGEIFQIMKALEMKQFCEFFDRDLCAKNREESNN